ncbi:MAG: hypothetical protein GY770_27085 [Aestuariibacter sp.]|nr:hypothetical protein [Aestuariibacter sp.]
MITNIALAIVTTLSLAFTSPSGWIDRDGNPIPDSAEQKSIGQFGAWLLLTNDVKNSLEKWNTPSETVYIDTSKNYKKNEYIAAFVFFSGCSENESGKCNLNVKYKIIQPDGKVYADIPEQEAWSKKPPGRSIQMSTAYIQVRIESHELKGTYEILADVIDNNSSQKLNLSSKFEISE